MKGFFRFLVLFSALALAISAAYAGTRDPVGVLFQTKGQVEYSKDGKKWRNVRRTKFLFTGYQVRTGADGSGKITIQETGKNMEVGPDTVLNVTSDGIKPINGKIEDVEESGQLISGLMKIFTKSQAYTTVRRSHKKKETKIEMARTLKLNEEHPDVVWENLGEKYHYQLIVGDQKIEVPATDSDVVRTKVAPFTGEKKVMIKVLDGDEVVTELKPYKSRGEEKHHTLIWLDQDKKDDYQQTVKKIEEMYGQDSFLLGSYYENQDMWVAAMDLYKKYLDENPEEVEMAPYLFRVYKKLQLDEVYKEELAEWKLATMDL